LFSLEDLIRCRAVQTGDLRLAFSVRRDVFVQQEDAGLVFLLSNLGELSLVFELYLLFTFSRSRRRLHARLAGREQRVCGELPYLFIGGLLAS
jgi:hypothetical protein